MTRNSILQTAFLLGLAATAQGIDTWTGGTSTDWADGTNWSNGNPPDGTDTVLVNNISDATTFTPSLTTAYTLDPDGPGGDMWVGGSGTGELNIDNGGSLNVQGNWLFVGENGGTGTINVNSGGAITGDNNIRLGRTGGNGTLNVDGGTISGVSGIITDGGATSAINVTNNGSVASTGNIQMHGTSSSGIDSGSIDAGYEFWVGGDGDSTTFLQTGGTVSSGAWFVIGRDGTNSEYTMTGGTVNAATSTVGSFAVVGSFGGSSGTLNVGGTGEFYVDSNRRLYIGEDGTGILNVTGDGLVQNTDTNEGGVRLGQNATGVGTVNLDGGTISTPQVSQGGGTGTFNFNGGTLLVNADESALTAGTFMGGLTRANVRDGGAVIDTDTFSVTVSQGLAHSDIGGDAAIDGGLTKQGAGTLILSGNNTYTGPTVVSAGTLAFSGGGAIDFTTGLTLADSTTLDVSAATVDPYPPALTFSGDAQLVFQATGDDTDQAIITDSLTTTPPNVITVDVTNTAGSWTGDPGGWSYPLIDHDGTYVGTVGDDFAIGTLTPALAPGQTAEIVDNGVEIALVITGDPLSWTGNISADWNTADNNWSNSGGATSFSGSQSVLFEDGATVFNVNLAEDVEPGLVQFSNLFDDYTISSSGGFGINGSASVAVDSGGSVTFTTENDYTGSTTISDGILVVSGDGSIESSSMITIGADGELQLNPPTSATYANPIGGTGFLTKLGSGTLTLSGANTLAGDIVMTDGQLNLNSAGALGTTDDAFDAFIFQGGVLDNTSGGIVNLAPDKPVSLEADLTFIGSNDLFLSNGAVTLNASRTIDVQAGTLGMGATVDGGAGYDLIKTGPGTLVLNGGNIAGDLDVQAGIVGLNQDFTGASPISTTGTGILENAGGVGTKWTRWNVTGDVTSDLLIRGNDGSHDFQLGLVKQAAGTLTLTNPANDIGAILNVDQGTLILEAGSYGRAADDGTTLNAFAASLGNAGDSTLVIDGASVDYNVADGDGTEPYHQSLNIGINGGHATVELVDGTLDVYRQMSAGWFGGAFGGFTQTGGTATVGGFLIAGIDAAPGVINLEGGVFNHSGPITWGASENVIGVVNIGGTADYNNTHDKTLGLWVGENGTATLNVSDSATMDFTGSTDTVLILGNNATSTGTVNLLGGTVTGGGINQGAGAGLLNFNGGTLAANSASATFLTGIDNTYVHAGGGTIDNGGNAITIGQELQAPAGNGVSATGLTVSGGGFIETPIVTITGGGGTGATAVAEIDANGDLTGITITNPGVNYTSAPTFALVGGGAGNTGAIGGAATLVANVSGGMTFTGAATTTLTEVNRYTGNTTIDAGTTVLVPLGAEVSVAPTTDGVSTKITGTGAITFQGKLRVDATNTDITDGNSWTVVDVATPTYDSSFGVAIAGVLDLTAQGDGVTHIGVDGNNTWTYSETTGVLSLAVTGAAPGYDTWLSTGGGSALTTGVNDGAEDNPDFDTYANVLEYILGGDPLAADNLVDVNETATDLVFTFDRYDDSEIDTTLDFQWGTTLADWGDVGHTIAIGATSSGPDANGISVDVTEDGGSTADYDLIEVTVPKTNAVNGKLFGRLQGLKP